MAMTIIIEIRDGSDGAKEIHERQDRFEADIAGLRAEVEDQARTMRERGITMDPPEGD